MLAPLSCFLLNIRSQQLLDWGCPGEVGEGGTWGTPVHPCGLEGTGKGWQQAPLNKWMGRACTLLPKWPWVLGSITHHVSRLLRMKSSIRAAAQPWQPLGDGSICHFGVASLPAIGA